MAVYYDTTAKGTGGWSWFCKAAELNGDTIGRDDFSQRLRCLNIVCRNDFLFTVSAVAVIAAVLFPLSARIFDVLLIFSISLTAAVVIAAFSASSALQVQGFPLLIFAVVTIRLVLSAAGGRLILSREDTGIIVGFLGDIVARGNYVPALFVFAALVIICFWIIFGAVRDIWRSGSDFITDIVPARQVCIEDDLAAGIIDKCQLVNLREEIVREGTFFFAMVGAARFIICGAVIEIVVVIVSIIGGMVWGAMAPTGEGLFPERYAALIVGTGAIAQVSALIVAAGCGHLVRKSFACAGGVPGAAGYSGRVKKVVNEAADETTFKCVGSMNYSEQKATAEEIEWFEEPGVNDSGLEGTGFWIWQENKDKSFYEAVARLIDERAGAERKAILMAAEDIEELGVTVPVNVGMRLARSGRRCLLIDLDEERGAISKVFDICGETGSSKQPRVRADGIVSTCVKNLWVWPSDSFCRIDSVNIKKVIMGLGKRYDNLIFYSPRVGRLKNIEGIAGSAGIAMLFAGATVVKAGRSAIGDLYRRLVSYGCVVLGPGEISVKVI